MDNFHKILHHLT